MARTEYGTTWWGEQWLNALTHIDYANRIPRGKTYANTGKVKSFRLDFEQHAVKARVIGHYDPFYTVTLKLPEISREQREKLLDAVASSPLILAKLSARELSPDILPLCEKIGIRLFPASWRDMDMQCSCPDSAVPCKHIAAVIYKMSQEIDANPFILFALRGIDLTKELALRGVEIGRALNSELPAWRDILKRADPSDAAGTFDASVMQDSNITDLYIDDDNTWSAPTEAETKEDWLRSLSALTFKTPAFEPDAQLALLSEKPAGYVGGNLRETVRKVLTAAAKVAKAQLTKLSEHTPPVFVSDEEHPAALISVNTWGAVRTSETLYWQEFDHESGKLVSCRVGDMRPDGSPVRVHEMFSGFLNAKKLDSEAEEIEAFYDAWVLAAKLMMVQAAMPQIYEPAEGCFAVRWIPATTSPEIRELTRELGALFLRVDKPWLEILGRPDAMSAVTMGEIVLGIFIDSFVRAGFEKVRGETLLPDNTALFAADYTDTLENPENTALRLRLSEWLSPLAQSTASVAVHLKPVLTVRDPWHGSEAHDTDKAAEEPLTVELGFLSMDENASGGAVGAGYATLKRILADPAFKPVRFDAMRTAARLSNHCAELTDLLRKGSETTLVTMQELTPLLFKAIPQLRLLGVKVILPKSLRKLLAPQATMQIDLAENWDVSQGFMGLMDLLDFDWKVAVGGEAISREELKALSAMAGRVVRFHDSFMFVDEKELTRIRNRIEAQKQGLTKMAILRAALTGDMDSSPVQLTEAVRTALQRLLKETDTPIPTTVKATLRPYQERGYRWMMRNVRIGIGSILADDMGLGKTLQVITLLEGLRTRRELKGKPALIVVPTSLITNWQRETARFAPKLKLHVYYGPGRALPGEKETVHAVLTTYGTLRSSVNTLAEHAWRLLILDEAQAVKNYRTSTFKSVRTVKADGVVAMSGTPVENRLMEYWSIMEATNPGLLGSATGFKNTFAQPIEIEHDEETAEQFKRVTAPFILRRLKTDKAIAPELPQKISTDEYCTLTKEQALLYDKVVKKSLEQINDGMSPMERRAMVLTLMMKLKQICNAPAQYAKDGSYASAEYSGKMQRLFGILEDLEAAGRKVLIFTQFREMGKLLQKWIGEKTGSTPKFIHGGVAQKERQAIVDSFQTNRSDKVLILSLKAAGTGLNLTAATAIIHYDLWWNPAVENQATDRAYRIGQKSSVNVYRFISAETFEEKINTMIESKKALAEMTVETGENWIGDLSKNELQEIFTLQTH